MSLVSIVLLRYFGSNSVFFSTVSFSNEDNHCQLYATLDFVKFIVSICEQTNDLSFTDKSAFWTSYFFFLEIMLESWGCGLYTSAAYTRVFTVTVDIENLCQQNLYHTLITSHETHLAQNEWSRRGIAVILIVIIAEFKML